VNRAGVPGLVWVPCAARGMWERGRKKHALCVDMPVRARGIEAVRGLLDYPEPSVDSRSEQVFLGLPRATDPVSAGTFTAARAGSMRMETTAHGPVAEHRGDRGPISLTVAKPLLAFGHRGRMAGSACRRRVIRGLRRRRRGDHGVVVVLGRRRADSGGESLAPAPRRARRRLAVDRTRLLVTSSRSREDTARLCQQSPVLSPNRLSRAVRLGSRAG
jgi:hypothetical protein